MKKISLFLVIMTAFLMLPFSVLADQVNTDSNVDSSQSQENGSSENDETSKEVKVYFFHGDGCPHCAEAEDFFESIEEEYGHLFEIVAYETWYDSSNAALLEKVGETRGEDITGVPYILIGNKSWAGYASDFDEEIIKKIEEEYETPVDERYDIMDLVDVDDKDIDKKDYSNDAIILIIILVVAAAVVGGVVVARKKTA